MILVAILQTLVAPDQIDHMHWSAWFDDRAGLCSEPTPGGGCSHAAPFQYGGEGSVHSSLADFLQILTQCSWSCPCIAKVLQVALDCLAACIMETLPSISRTNPIKEQHYKVGIGRIARVDEDYRRALASSRSRGCSTMEAAASIDPELGDGSRQAPRWSAKSIQQHTASAIEAHSKGLTGVHSLIEDAARLGNPAEETIIFQHWSDPSMGGHWLVPQASSVSHQGRPL